MHKFYFIAALVVLLACLVHASPWIYFATSESPYLRYPLPEAMNLVETTHYLTLERAFWSYVENNPVSMIVLDDNLPGFVKTPERPDSGFDLIGLGYTDMKDLVPEGDAFQPVVGLQSRPRYVFRKKR